MLKALHYCHKIIKVIHRDIKPDNIMINHNDEAVLIDFGVSALVDNQENDKLKDSMGTYLYYAPEMFANAHGKKNILGEKTDMWALGITFYELITGVHPFIYATNELALKDAILNDPIDFEKIKSKQVRPIIERLLRKDANERGTIETCLKSAWVTKNGTEEIDLTVMDYEPQFLVTKENQIQKQQTI